MNSSPSLPHILLLLQINPSQETLPLSLSPQVKELVLLVNAQTRAQLKLLPYSPPYPPNYSNPPFSSEQHFPFHLPSFPISDEASLLLQESRSIEKLSFRMEPKMSNFSVCNLPYFQFEEPGSPLFDAESILGNEVEEDIDTLLGMENVSMSSNCIKDGNLDCLMGFGELGFGFDISSNTWRALRKRDEGEWWWADVVDVRDVVPRVNVTPAKTKMKKKKGVVEDIAIGSSPEDGILRPRLWLKLDYGEVMKEWSGGSPFSGEVVPVESVQRTYKKSLIKFTR